MQIYYILLTGLIIYGLYHTIKIPSKYITLIFMIISAAVLTIIAAFRYAIGFDYFSYQAIYKMIWEIPFTQAVKQLPSEELFVAFCKAMTLLHLSYAAFLFVSSVIMHSTAAWFIYRYSKIPWLSVYLYIALQFFAYNMNLIRQAFAVTCFLLAYPFLVRRRLLPYMLIIIAGSFIHFSILAAIPLYFLLPLKITKKSLIMLACLTFIAYLACDPLISLLTPLLPTKYSQHESSIFWLPGKFDYVVLPAIYFILILLFYKKLLLCGKNASLYLNSALYTFIITFFLTRHFLLERFAIYPFTLSIVAIPEIVHSYHVGNGIKPAEHANPKKTEIYVLCLFLCFGFAYFAFAAYKGFHNTYPYISIFDKARSNPG